MSRQRELRRRQLAGARDALRHPPTVRWRSPWLWSGVLVVAVLAVTFDALYEAYFAIDDPREFAEAVGISR